MADTVLQLDGFKRIDKSSGYRFYQVDGYEEFPSVTTVLKVPNKPALVPWAAKEERKMVLEAAAMAYRELPGKPKLSEGAFMRLVGERIGLVKAYKKEMEKASSIGTEVHNRAEWDLKTRMNLDPGPEPALTTKAAKESYKKYEQYLDEHHFEPLLIEKTVWSFNGKFAGTMDWLAYLDGILTVGDWKTSKSLHGEYDLQIAALAKATLEQAAADTLTGSYAINQTILNSPLQGCAVRLPKTEEDPDPEFKIIPLEKLVRDAKSFLGLRDAFDWFYEQDLEGQKAYREKKKKERATA